MKKGIDVSVWDGPIDWIAIKPDFAILRVGFGNNLVKQDDPNFLLNAQACTDLGIPFGVYITSYADNVEKAKSEADHVLRLIKGFKLNYPVYYHLSENAVQSNSGDVVIEISKAFAERIESAGYSVGFAASEDLWTARLTDTYYNIYSRWVIQHAEKCTYKGKCDLWQYEAGKDCCYAEFGPAKEAEPKESKAPAKASSKKKKSAKPAKTDEQTN